MPSILRRKPWVALGLALLAMPAAMAQAQPVPSQMSVGGGLSPAQFSQPPGGGGRIMSVPNTMGAGGGAPGFVPPFNPYFPGAFNPYAGGALTGAANLVGAQGQLMVSQQQAYLGRENVRAEKINNKRRAFDEYMYEKENTPTAEQDRQKANKMYLDRARNNPPSVEIWNGSALNTLLTDLKRNGGGSGRGNASQMPLDPDMLKNINVSAGTGNANAGLLSNGGNLPWPDALMDPQFKSDRDHMASLLDEAVKQATFNGAADRGTVRQIQTDADALSRSLKKSIDSIDMNSYIEAKTFLSNLDSAIIALKSPNAGNYFNGKYSIKGAKNVDELVNYMSANGLTFAGSVPGQENAYNALYTAMANYDVSLQATAANR